MTRCPLCFAMVRPGVVAEISHRVSECRPLPAARTETRTRAPRPKSEKIHGTYSSYIHGCRCEDCTVAHREHQRAYRARRRAAAGTGGRSDG